MLRQYWDIMNFTENSMNYTENFMNYAKNFMKFYGDIAETMLRIYWDIAETTYYIYTALRVEAQENLLRLFETMLRLYEINTENIRRAAETHWKLRFRLDWMHLLFG